MPNELNLDLGQSGQTITARLVQGAAFMGSAISCPESGTVAGFYSGSVPSGTAAGTYQVRFLNGSTVVGSGTLNWSGAAEVSLLDLSTGVPQNNVATSQTVGAGSVVSGSFANTAADDGVSFSLAPSTLTGLSVDLEFQIGSQFPSSVTVNGHYNSTNNRFVNVSAFNWQSGQWEQLSDSLSRINHSTTDSNYAYPLVGRHREGSGAQGRVRIRFTASDLNATFRLNLDQVLVKSASASVTAAEIAEAVRMRQIIESYRRDIGVTLSSVSGTAGDLVGDNGIPQNPTTTMTDALTIANDPRIMAKQFFVVGGSSFALNQDYTDWGFLGQNEGVLWSANLNGRNLPGCVISYARISGSGLSTAARMRFERCVFTVCSLGNAIAFDSVLGAGSVLTAISGADISLRSCYTVDTSGTPAINFAAPAAATTIRVQGHNGSIRVQGMNSNSTMQFGGNGQITIEESCTGGTVFVESTAAVVNNGSGVTVTRLNAIAAIPTNPLLTNDARLNNLDASISSRMATFAYTAPDNTGIGTLLSRLSAARAANLDNLNAQISTRLASQDYTAPPSVEAISTEVQAAIINEGDGQQVIDAFLQIINANLNLPALELQAIAQAVRGALATELARIDEPIGSRLAAATYTAPNNAAIEAVAQAVALLPNSGAIAEAVEAQLVDEFGSIATGLSTLQAHGDTAWATATGFSTHNPADVWSHTERTLTSGGGGGGLTAADVWGYSDRTLTSGGSGGGDATAANQQAILTAVQAIPTTPPNNDAIAAINQRLPLNPAAIEDVQVIVNPTPVSGQFEAEDRNLLQQLKALAEADESVTPTRYRKLAAGTQTVLLDKNVTDDGAGTVTVTRRP